MIDGQWAPEGFEPCMLGRGKESSCQSERRLRDEILDRNRLANWRVVLQGCSAFSIGIWCRVARSKRVHILGSGQDDYFQTSFSPGIPRVIWESRLSFNPTPFTVFL